MLLSGLSFAGSVIVGSIPTTVPDSSVKEVGRRFCANAVLTHTAITVADKIEGTGIVIVFFFFVVFLLFTGGALAPVIGITTDYGGAISLGIGGQEIRWGREGGSISFGIGGFEVYVEARNCVVVETKSIFGQIVAQRSYPDPGCKLPDPPIPPAPPEPPQSPNGIDPTNITDTKNGYILLGQYHYSVVYSYKNPLFPKETEKETIAFI